MNTCQVPSYEMCNCSVKADWISLFNFALLASWLINDNVIVEQDKNAVLRPLLGKRGNGSVISSIAKPIGSAITTTTVDSKSNITKLTEYRLTR